MSSAACTRHKGNVEPVGIADAAVTVLTPLGDPEPSASASASASAEQPSPLTPSTAAAAPVPVTAHSYEQLCPEVAALADAGPPTTAPPAVPMPTAMSSVAPPAGRAGDVMVTARLETRGKDFVALVAARALGVERKVFSVPTVGDPYQCCTEATASELVVKCFYSGIDSIEGRAIARRDGDALVVRWCTGDLSTGSVSDRGEVKKALRAGADLRFAASTPACHPRSVP